ncbi:MAG TPA: hypothetical protein ENO27_02005 [Caldithrix sp.]|nr:hypothetical protein [Caldithrix sp.]
MPDVKIDGLWLHRNLCTHAQENVQTGIFAINGILSHAKIIDSILPLSLYENALYDKRSAMSISRFRFWHAL